MKNKYSKNGLAQKEIIFKALESIPEQLLELDSVANAITELKATKEALRISEEKYRLVFSHVPLGILHFDSKGIITACNDNFVNINDSDKDKIIGFYLAEVLDANLFSAIENAIAGTVGHYEGEYLSKTSGKITPVRVNFAPIFLKDGTLSGGIGIFEDITERKQIERIFFHDILNTAGNLNNMLELLHDDTTNVDEQKEYMKILDEIAKRIIDEIVTHRHLVSSEKSKIKLNIQKTSSFKILKKIFDSFSPEDILNGKKLVFAQENIDSEFETDEILLGRVLNNMLKNALEASHSGDVITLLCGVNKDTVHFAINNPGVIPENIKSQLFNRSISTKGSGRGIGIYSMKLLTEKYLNGKIEFTSVENKGTTFVVEYPICFNK